jgi:hypothetical protein
MEGHRVILMVAWAEVPWTSALPGQTTDQTPVLPGAPATV